jgi:hypothetical protein
MRPVLLDHSIVGQSATTLTIRKDREYAACRICGDIFQPWLNTDTPNHAYTPEVRLAADIEILQWRNKHNLKHSDRQHKLFIQSGRTLSPEAAIRLAPFGLVPVGDSGDEEIIQALAEAPRAPVDDAINSLKRKGY